VSVNESLPDSPETINSDPYGVAWMVKLELTDPTELDGLMNATAYEAKVSESE
jgi:glycine cleavage system H protein